MLSEVKINHVYRNIKGQTDYVVEDIGFDSRDGTTPMVWYRPLTGGRAYSRTYDEFLTKFEATGQGPLRPDVETYYLRIVEAVSARGTCSRRRVGALAVLGDRILATGYNGAPAGAPHCHHEAYVDPNTDPDLAIVNGRHSCQRAIHAEANVIAFAAKYGVSLKGAVIYCNTFPCFGCAKTMVTAGVKQVIFKADYFNDPAVTQLCDETGLVLTRSA